MSTPATNMAQDAVRNGIVGRNRVGARDMGNQILVITSVQQHLTHRQAFAQLQNSRLGEHVTGGVGGVEN